MSRLQRAQHKRRLSWMPWLYYTLKPKHLAWAVPWQARVQQRLASLETVHFGENCFLAPEARIFAEPGRDAVFADGSSIAAQAFLRGPITVGARVSINVNARLDGGRRGIRIGDDSRIASGVSIYAFNHGMEPDRPIREQNTRSRGIEIGHDVWIGANAGITDGVVVGDHAVVGMGAIVTADVEPWAIMAGVPARKIGDRRDT